MGSRILLMIVIFMVTFSFAVGDLNVFSVVEYGIKDPEFMKALDNLKKVPKKFLDKRYPYIELYSRVTYKVLKDASGILVKYRSISYVNNTSGVTEAGVFTLYYGPGAKESYRVLRVYDPKTGKFYFPSKDDFSMSVPTTMDFFQKEVNVVVKLPKVGVGKIVDIEGAYVYHNIKKKIFGRSMKDYTRNPICEAVWEYYVEKPLKLHWKVYNEDAFKDPSKGKPVEVSSIGKWNYYKWIFRKFDMDKREPSTPAPIYFRPYVMVTTADSWKFYGDYFKELGLFELLTRPTPFYRKLAETIIGDAKTVPEKVNAVIKWINKNIHYLGLEIGTMGWIPVHPMDTLKNKFADCKGYATLLTALLRSLGIKAYQAVVFSGQEYKNDINFPYIVTNHMIAAVEYKGKIVIVDPTDTTTKFGTLPVGDRDSVVMVIKYDDPEYYKVVKTPWFINQYRSLLELDLSNGVDSIGYYYKQWGNEHTDSVRRHLYKDYNLKRAEYDMDNVFGGKAVISVDSYKVHNIDNWEKNVWLEIKGEVAGLIKKTDGVIFVPSIYKTNLISSVAADEKRSYPIYVGAPNDYGWEIQIKLPQGYKPLRLVSKKIDEGVASYEYEESFDENRGVFTVKSVYIRKKAVMTPAEYLKLRKIYYWRDKLTSRDYVFISK